MTLLGALALLGAGLLSFASPCVLPLIPVWAGLAIGDAGDSPVAVFRATCWFVGGFSTVFVLLGAASGQVGGWLSGADTWLPRVGGVAVAAFGLVMIGFGGSRLSREVRPVAVRPAWATGRSTALRSGIAGIAFGAAWTPCVGPLLGSALVVAGRSSSPLSGAGLLSAYSLGVGLPFLAASLALASWPEAQRRLLPIAARLRVAGGFLLVVTGVALAAGASDWLLSPAAKWITPT